jgi:integrase
MIVLGFENGKRKTRSKSGFKTKKEALEYLPMLRDKMPSVDANIKFSKLYEQWYAAHSPKVEKTTMNCYAAAYKYFQIVHNWEFSLIKSAHLQKCIDECPNGKRTKQNMKALGTLLYKYAIQNDISDKNYAEFLYVGNDAQQEREPFTANEMQKLFDSVPKNPDARYILCLCYLGFRPEEFLKIRQKDFDRENMTLCSGSKTEAGKNRIVPISPKIAQYVLELSEGKDYIFSPSGEKISQKIFREKIFYPALENAKIRRLTPYSCRHTFATLMKNVQAPTTDKQKLIGHANFEMTAHYTHTDIESLRNIIDKL